MFPRTSNGQKPVDMFLANLKTVDMFLEPKVRTGRIVDMFLTAFLRTGTKNDYLFHFLVLRRDCHFDVEKVIREKGWKALVSWASAFRRGKTSEMRKPFWCVWDTREQVKVKKTTDHHQEYLVK